MKSLYEVGKEQTGSWCSDTIIEMKEEISMKKVLLMVEEGNMSHIVNGEFGGTPMTQSEEIANLTKSVKSGKLLMERVIGVDCNDGGSGGKYYTYGVCEVLQFFKHDCVY